MNTIYGRFLIYVLIFSILSACKKEKIENNSSNGENRNIYSAEVLEACNYGGIISDDIETVIRVYGEDQLANVLNGSIKNNVRIYLMPNQDGEFLITGQYFNTSSNPFDDKVAIFENFNFLQITTDLNATGGVRTRVVFKPNGNVLNKFIRRLFVFRNCHNVHIREVDFTYDWDPSSPTGPYDGHYYSGMLYFEGEKGGTHCSNVLINDVILKGTKFGYNITPSTAFHDLPYSTAIYVGKKLDENISHEEDDMSESNYHNNIGIVGCEIYNFRIAGINMNLTNNGCILNNTIEYIWESDPTFRSQAGGVHLRHTNNTRVEQNYIHSIFSVWPNFPTVNISSMFESERYQHGIYVSNLNNNLLVNLNTIEYVSGTGIKVSFIESNYDQTPSDGVEVTDNIVKFCYNFGIFSHPASNLTIINNSIYHCLYKMNQNWYSTGAEIYKGFSFETSGEVNPGGMGMLHLQESHGGQSSASNPNGVIDGFLNLVVKNNVVKSSVSGLYDSGKNQPYLGSDPNKYKARIAYFQLTIANNNMVIQNNSACLENAPSGFNVCTSELLFSYLVTGIPHLHTYTAMETPINSFNTHDDFDVYFAPGGTCNFSSPVVVSTNCLAP